MNKYKFSIIVILLFSISQIIYAQDSNIVVLKLKNGYSVKGEIIEESISGVKIKTINGEIFEYSSNEILSKEDSSNTSYSKIPILKKKLPQIYTNGDKVINLGIGFFKQLDSDFYINNDDIIIPPIPISFEYILKDNLFDDNGALGIGGFIGYTSTEQANVKFSRFVIGARGYLHYNIIEKLDTYTGIFLGYSNNIAKTKKSNYSNSNRYSEWDPKISAFIGCRYYFNDNIAATAEIGWDISIISLGLSYRF